MKKVLITLMLGMTAFVTKAQDTTKREVVTLNEAIVTATRASKKTPVAQTTMDNDAIQQSNIGADVPYIMELMPSVIISSESGLGLGNTSFRIRGSDASRTNVTIDGIPINDAESQGVFWVNMPDFASSVGSIQIQRGVGTSSNGAGAFGATVNMQTANPKNTPYAELSTSAGMYNTFRNTIKVGTGIMGKGFTFDARYSNVQSDGYIERSWAHHQSLFASGAWQGKNTAVRATLLYGEEHTAISWNGVPGYAIDSVKYPYYEAGVPGYNPGINRRYNPSGEYRDSYGNIQYYSNQSDNYKQTHYRLQLSHQFSDRWTAHVALHLTRGIGYYEEYKRSQKLKNYGLPNVISGSDTLKKSDLIRQKWMSNYFYGLTFSTNYTTETLQWIIGGAGNRYDGDHYGKVLWERYNTGADNDREWYRNNGTKDDYTLYSKATWQPIKVMSLYADVQYRYIGYVMSGNDDDLASLNQSHYFNFVNPKAGVYFNFSKEHSAYASFAVANREPSRADFKDASKYDSHNSPTPERLYDTELGYQFTNQKASIGINFYYMYYKDQLVSTGKLSDVGYTIMQNVPVSYRAGIELTGGVQLLSPLRLEANVTLSENKIKNFTAYTDQYDNNVDWTPIDQKVEYLGTTNISFSPNVIASALLRYTPVKDVSLSLTGKYVGSQYYDNTSSANRKLDAYFVSNLRIDYSFKLYGLQCELQGLVNNLFNKQYITSAWVYRAVFNDSSPDYVENGFFPQAGTNVVGKLTISF